MKKNNTGIFVGILLIVITLVSFSSTFFIYQNKVAKQAQEDEETIKVVTSFYPMYIATMNVIDGIDGVELESLSEPQTGCLHDYVLTTEDMKNLSTADVLIVNGGGIESFIEEVAKTYPDLVVIQACDGVELLADGDEENAHAWMDVSLYEKQVENIAAGLAEYDSANADKYKANASAYEKRLQPLADRMSELKEEYGGGNIIIFHEAYDYVADALGMEVVFVMDLDEERQISAGEQADVLTVTRGEYYEDSYIDHMNENIDILERALTDIDGN